MVSCSRLAMVSWRHLQPGRAQPRACNRRKRLQLWETPSGQACRGERRRCSSLCCFDGVVNRAVLPATLRLWWPTRAPRKREEWPARCVWWRSSAGPDLESNGADNGRVEAQALLYDGELGPVHARRNRRGTRVGFGQQQVSTRRSHERERSKPWTRKLECGDRGLPAAGCATIDRAPGHRRIRCGLARPCGADSRLVVTSGGHPSPEKGGATELSGYAARSISGCGERGPEPGTHLADRSIVT